jgi:hypothetical protein
VATKTIKVSDLSGSEIRDEEQLARIVVEEHPELTEPIILEVLPDEVEAAIPEEQNYVRLTYYPAEASGGEPKTVMLLLEEFNNLAQSEDMATVLKNAQAQQQEQDGRRRGKRGSRRGTGQRRERKDFASPEYAGLPHRGRITNAEKEYVRNNLDAVNERRVKQGHDPIDPADPEMASRYGLTASEPDIIEQEMQDQANL